MNIVKEVKQLMKKQQYEKAQHLLLPLLESQETSGDIFYLLASTYDALGDEGSAVTYYEQALEKDLDDGERKKTLLQLGSTYRALGEYKKARLTLEQGRNQYPDEPVFDVFYAMVMYNLYDYEEAVKLLLQTLVQTSKDSGIVSYAKALNFYSEHLNETWKE